MSGILLHTMATHNGNDLLETLADLNIQTGQLSENAISAWFDTDSENEKHLLNWLCNLDRSNILSPVEKQEHDEILKSNSFIGLEECEKEMDDILLHYPTLLNTDDNLLDIQLLENEIETLIETEARQELLISKTKEVGEELSRDIAKLTTEKNDTSLLKGKELEHCTQLCTHLDNLNVQLESLIQKLNVSLYNFQRTPVSSFFSNIDIVPYFDFTDIVTSSIGIYLKENCEDTAQSLALISSLNLDYQTETDEQLQSLKERIYQSTLNYLRKQIDEKCRMAELEYLKTFTSSLNLNASVNLEYPVDVSLESKSKLDLMNHQLESYVDKLSYKHIRGPEISLIKDKLARNEMKLNKALSLKEALLRILRYQNVLLSMYKTEQEMVGNTDTLFREVSTYIIEDLKECETRTGKMLEKTKVYANLESADRSHRLIQCITSLLSNEVNSFSSLTEAINAMNAFRTSKDLLLKELYTGNFNRFINIYKERNANNAIMIEYLQSGPISRITVIPHPLLHLFMEIDGLLAVQKKKLMEAVDAQKYVQLKLEKNKWLRYRRQLWMHFLMDPKKMLMYIDEIQLNLKHLSKIG